MMCQCRRYQLQWVFDGQTNALLAATGLMLVSIITLILFLYVAFGKKNLLVLLLLLLLLK